MVEFGCLIEFVAIVFAKLLVDIHADLRKVVHDVEMEHTIVLRTGKATRRLRTVVADVLTGACPHVGNEPLGIFLVAYGNIAAYEIHSAALILVWYVLGREFLFSFGKHLSCIVIPV